MRNRACKALDFSVSCDLLLLFLHLNIAPAHGPIVHARRIDGPVCARDHLDGRLVITKGKGGQSAIWRAVYHLVSGLLEVGKETP